ncbi:hypothetical protein HDU98_004853 [Podochytrium sp. JEL0797]|nr:hypothetical protein HDU98_004853 [Podochytrium sp. JEL0797]
MATFESPTPKALNAVHRLKDRASYDEESVYTVLDHGLIAHVGFTLPASIDGSSNLEDWPIVMPMAYARINNTIYLHGYVSGRLMKALAGTGEVGITKSAITVTLVDGLVMAVSPFSHSMNYRSCCVFGYPELVTDQEEKETALSAITNHCFKGGDRWGSTRKTSKVEYQTTKVIRVDIEAASVKQRAGQAHDEEADMALDNVFSGVLPLVAKWGIAEPTEYNRAPVPDYVKKMEGTDAS